MCWLASCAAFNSASVLRLLTLLGRLIGCVLRLSHLRSGYPDRRHRNPADRASAGSPELRHLHVLIDADLLPFEVQLLDVDLGLGLQLLMLEDVFVRHLLAIELLLADRLRSIRADLLQLRLGRHRHRIRRLRLTENLLHLLAGSGVLK